MPFKPSKICREINCHTIIPGTESHCSQHQKKSWDIKRKYNPFYSSKAWKRLSKVFRQRHPFCIECKKKGRDTLTTHTDHIIAIEDGGAPLDWKNLQPLCTSHHSSKTAKEIRSRQDGN